MGELHAKLGSSTAMCARTEAGPTGGGGAWPGFETTHRATYQRPGATVWRAPEGPEGTGGLRGAAPNEVRSPSLAGGRALRRPEHQRRHKHQHAARTARGRAAAHRHTQRPGPPAPRTPVGPQATQPHSRALRRPEHQRRPAHQRHNTPRRHNKAARPHRGRAAQQVSEAHRRTTTMSGSPRPLSWRTLEIPSLAATSFAVPSMRGSS